MAEQGKAFMRRREPKVPREVSGLREQADLALRNLEDALSRYEMQRSCAIGIQFPRGYLRRVVYFTAQKWGFVKEKELVKALAYRAQQLDFLQWVMNRLDIDLTVLEGTVFWGLVLAASICEALCFAACQRCARTAGRLQAPRKFQKMISLLCREGLIDKALAAELDWLRDVRNNIHPHVFSERWATLGRPGFGVEDFNRAVRLCDALTEALRAHYGC